MLQALTPQACGHSGPQEARSQESLSLPPPSSFPQMSPLFTPALANGSDVWSVFLGDE